MLSHTAALLARAEAIAAGLDAFPASGGAPPPPASVSRWRSAVEAFAADARAAVEAEGNPAVVIAVADLGSKLRDVDGGRGGGRGAAPSTPRRVFIRHTTKFLVAPGKEAELATALACRLGISLVGDRSPLRPPPGWAGGAVTSVYLDAPPAFPVHAARSAKVDGAALSRVRWYGASQARAWVETKTHRAPEAGARSSKERVGLEPAVAASLLDAAVAPPPGLPPLAAALASAVRAQAAAPVLATTARRLAFEGARVRVTLDQGLTWLGGAEHAAGLRAWVAAGGATPPCPLPAATCPLTVLEVKVPFKEDGTPAPPPAWLASLVSDPSMAASAPRLSKYLAGAVALHPSAGLSLVGCLDDALAPSAAPAPPPSSRDGGSATPVEPPPLPPKPAPATPAKPRGLALPWKKGKAERGGGGSFRRTGSRAALLPVVAEAGPAAGGPAPAWPPRRVTDAKVFFANERTLLSWIQISVLLLLLGVSLLNGGGGGGGRESGAGGPGLPGQADPAPAHASPASSPATKIGLVAGGVVAPLAVLFVGYAFVVFRGRSARLAAGLSGGAAAGAFDDARGAAVLVALVLLAGVASLAAAFARVGEGV